MADPTECRHCGHPITTVTLGGVTVWTHDRDDTVLVHLTSPNAPRMCGGNRGTMAAPKEEP